MLLSFLQQHTVSYGINLWVKPNSRLSHGFLLKKQVLIYFLDEANALEFAQKFQHLVLIIPELEFF